MSPGLQHYLDVAQRFQAGQQDSPRWVRALRQEGLEQLARQGFPTTRHEDWKYTDVAPIVSGAFAPVAASAQVELKAQVEALALPGPRLVFVDGRLSSGLSSLKGLSPGVTVRSLREIMREPSSALFSVLCQKAQSSLHPFVALNAALLDEGAFIHILAGTVAASPVQLLFLSSGASASPVLSSPRVVVVTQSDCEAVLVELYAGVEGAASFTNAVTEVVLGSNARLHHYKLQAEADTAFHVASLHAEQGRDSGITSHSFALGGLLARNEVSVVFAGEGGECTLNGLYVGHGSQHLDNRTELDHAVPRCTSRELYKGVLDGRSRGTFHGRVLVRPDAQRTDASQTNRNLLLSEQALVDTRPQLEILADDVKCAHGAAVGRLDEQALFYLRTRGIPRAEAERLLTHAFASEVVKAIVLEPFRARVEQLLAVRLPGGARTEVVA